MNALKSKNINYPAVDLRPPIIPLNVPIESGISISDDSLPSGTTSNGVIALNTNIGENVLKMNCGKCHV